MRGPCRPHIKVEEHSQQGLVKDGNHLGRSRGGSSKPIRMVSGCGWWLNQGQKNLSSIEFWVYLPVHLASDIMNHNSAWRIGESGPDWTWWTLHICKPVLVILIVYGKYQFCSHFVKLDEWAGEGYKFVMLKCYALDRQVHLEGHLACKRSSSPQFYLD